MEINHRFSRDPRDWEADVFKLECRDQPRRLRQLSRILLIIQLLAPLRHGATIRDLATDIGDELEPFCHRTIRRDLEALELLTLVRRETTEQGVKWLWNRSPRTNTLITAADEVVS